jgi:hypothetical protein
MSLKIVLFDDMQENRDEVVSALRLELAGNGSVKPFTPGAGGKKNGTFEERLELDLTVEPNAPVDLIVADRDLSSYAPDYTGLSESTVRRVADMVGVPECGYARGERADDSEYIKRGEQRESCIRLSRKPNDAVFAKQVVAVGNGFVEITKKLSEITKPAERKSPGRMLANVLGKPEYAEKVSLYASGDQGRLGALAAVRDSKNANERNRRLACVLGYWLWDSVLRFPGVVLNEVAASSYLNIRLDNFKQDESLRQLFAGAVYAGPFAEAKPILWWRGMLDDLVAEAGATDGKTYAEKKLEKTIARSECCEDASKQAGYYCFLSEKPVSLENSKPGLPWFPRGADLARVCKSSYEEDEPWL